MLLIEAGAPFEALLGDGEGFGRIGSGRGFPNGRDNRDRMRGKEKIRDRSRKAAEVRNQETHAKVTVASEDTECAASIPTTSRARSRSRRVNTRGMGSRGRHRDNPRPTSTNL